MNSLPKDVQADLDIGFIITDQDDRFQRCLKHSDTTFEYKVGTSDDNNVEEAIIDVSKFSESDKSVAISGYYDSMEHLIDEMDNDQAEVNMIIAECYFETEIDGRH